MANTYTQLSIHAVFAVKGRKNIILKDWRNELHRYINALLSDRAKTLAVGGWKDHIHIFFGLPPDETVSDILKHVKANSSRWINDKNFVTGKFQWQDGYGAFAHSHSQRDQVIKYILNQEAHHQTKSFKTEYLGMLKKSELEYDDRYLFEFYD